MTRHLLERIHYNIVENQTSSVEDKFGYYELTIDKLARRIELLESNLNHYVNFNKHEALR